MKGITKKLLSSIIVAILLFMSCSQIMSYAATIYTRGQRFDGKTYTFNNTTVWDYNIGQSDVNDYYCLKGGAVTGTSGKDSNGFAYEDGYESYSLLGKSASQVENATGIELQETVSYGDNWKITNSDGQGKEKSLRAIKFLARNMYLVSSSTKENEKTYMKNHIKEIISHYASNNYKNVDLSVLNDELIGTIQQFVLWRFVKSDNTSAINYPTAINSEGDLKKIKVGGTALTSEQAKSGYALYSSLCAAAIHYAVSDDTTYYMYDADEEHNYCNLTRNSTTITLVNESNNWYSTDIINKSFKNVESFKFTGFSITNNPSMTVKSWQITDENGIPIQGLDGKTIANNPTTVELVDILPDKFKIKFSVEYLTEGSATIESMSAKLTYNCTFKPSLSKYSANIYYKENRQPIIEISKNVTKLTKANNLLFKYNYELFDLSLTKEITDIYRYNGTEYAQVYNSKNDGSRFIKTKQTSGTTPEYIMNKTPIAVTAGDIIRYKMTIRNEGDKDGLIGQVKDYLPDGLEYLNISSENTSSSNTASYDENNKKNENSKEMTVDHSNSSIIIFNFGNASKPSTLKKIDSGDEVEIYVECIVKNNVTVGDTLRNIAVISQYGYLESGKYIQSTTANKGTKQIDIDSEQDNMTTYTDFNNTINNGILALNVNAIANGVINSGSINDTNYLNSIDKGVLVSQDDEDFEQVKVGGFDLALRKFITKVESSDGSVVTTTNRIPKIYKDTTFENGQTTAKYYHSKTPVKVSQNDKVTYTIRIFNEGYIAGYAKEIIDYLPTNLVLAQNSIINNNYGWTSGGTTSEGLTIVKTTKQANTLISPSNGLEKFKKVYEGTHSTSDYTKENFFIDVQIECQVNGATNGTVLTNMAEISSYGYNQATIDKAGKLSTTYKNCNVKGVDVDSQSNPNLLTNLDGSNIKNKKYEKTGAGYVNYATDTVHSIYKDSQNCYIGLEDDDDFENVIVDSKFDLALRKYISKVTKSDGSNLTISNRVPEIKKDSIDALKENGTALYYHRKNPVEVSVGDIVTYTLRIYNEGKVEGIVKELKDYFPSGLELVEDSEINREYGWSVVNEDTEKNIITIKTGDMSELTVKPSNGYEGYQKLNENQLNTEDKFWVDVQVELKVTDTATNNSILTNIAEITKYGYYANENFVEANEVGKVDIDSKQDDVLNGEDGIGSYYKRRYENNQNNQLFNYDDEDDDDFENIRVIKKFDLKLTLNKTNEDGTTPISATFNVWQSKVSDNILEDALASEENIISYNIVKSVGLNTVSIGSEQQVEGSKDFTVKDLEDSTNYFYILKELDSSDGYKNIFDGYTILVPTHINEDGTLELNTTYSEFNTKYNKGFVILKDNDDETYSIVDENDELYSKITVEAVNTSTEIPQVKITVKNDVDNGSYRFQIIKKDIDTNERIGNIKFNVKRTESINNSDGTVTTNEPVQMPSMTTSTSTNVNNYGKKTSGYISINGEGTDVIELTEVADNTNAYLELAEPLKIYITKELKDSKYKATKVALEEAAEGSTDVTLNGVKLSGSNDTVSVRARIVEPASGNTLVEITIENKKISGSYSLQLEKTGADSAKLEGVKFAVDLKGQSIGEEFTTNGDGLVSIVENKAIEETGIDWYEITEMDLGNNDYIKIEPFKVYVQTTISEDGSAYILNRASFASISDNNKDVVKTQINNKNTDGWVYAYLELDDKTNTVKVKVENQKIEGEYKLRVKKTKDDLNGEGIAGISFSAVTEDGETSTPVTTDKQGYRTILSKEITKDNFEDVDTYVIKEVNLNNKPYVKLNEDITVYVHKSIVDGEYRATSVSFKKDEVGAKSATLEGVKLEDNKGTVDVKAKIVNHTSSLGNCVYVIIPNIEISGTYDMELLKTTEDGKTALPNVKFTVVKGEGEDAETVVDGQTTGNDGKIKVVESEKITEENVGIQDVYTIKENSTNSAYLKITSELKVYVTKEKVGNVYKASKVSFASDSEVKETDVTFADGTTLKAKAEITSDGIVRITVPNKEIEGNYGLQIIKTAEDDKPLEGVEFKVSEGDSTKEITLSKNTTDENGKLTLFTERKITSSNLEAKDVFTITEVKTNDSYVALPEALTIYVTKALNAQKTAYVASSVSFESEKQVTTKDITLPNGKTVTVSLDIVDGLVTVTIPNHKIEGSYDLELIKLDQKDGVSALPGVTFDITTKKGSEEVKLYDTKGEEIKTKGLTTNSEGKIVLQNVKITEGASYNFEITETKVPNGYVMLKDPIKLSFNTKVDSSTKKYVLANASVNSVAELEAGTNKLTIKVKNGQFDLALRKFITGVTVAAGTSDEKIVELPNRVPVFKVDENGNYVYEHSKDTVLLGNQNVVEYTIRVYNEGSINGYASKIKDDIPDGLEFLPDDETNKKYGWILLDEEGNEVKEVNKAKYIETSYLSKENEENTGDNLLKAFNTKDYAEGKITEPDYKEVKVAFKVTIPSTDNRIIVNKAQISDDSDENGDDITDIDSTPDEWIDGEDDQDTEQVKVQYFDLSLRKWVTKAIVIEDGKESVTETGHKAEDDPEEIVKVDLKDSKINSVVVKFEYKIRVTNEGEIAGYAKEISDYIPEGLRFNAADNPNWKESDGKIVTTELENTLLNPGETAEVSVILTWINRKDNMGLKKNVAEISKDYNIYGSPDIDSTPNNQEPGEDDIDDAPVMLTVKTGQAVTYVGLVIAILAILGSGVVMIKKYVIK